MLFRTRRAFAGVALAALTLVATARPAVAQDVMTKESAAAVKASFLVDLETMRGKFVGLAEAFPQDKFAWRPMDGVRSVSEVLMLAAMEGYTFIPGSFGAKTADLGGQEGAAKLRTIADKAAVIEHINKGFAHAKAALEGLDAATLTGKRMVMRREMSVADVALIVGGDLHEHLGQMIAYARMNKVVPPWSK